MALAAPTLHDRKRVKVYELKNNDWYDRGTGFCAGQYINDEARIYVESEDQPERTLLETKISKDDGYQKQQDTLIVWTEMNGVDMALSFQEAEGCGLIWDFVSEVQARLTALSGPEDGLSDDALESFNSVMLPRPELAALPEIEHHVRNASSNPAGRDALAKFIINEDYISKLVPLVEVAEDLESLADLHRLCNIMKTLILLNDSAIIEYVVTDNVILGVVGALEYDPDFPSHKANHRQYLSDESKFKEVVKIQDPNIRKKIHWTYRLQYLKDVVLARILDDPTFSVLNSLIFFHQVEIVQHLQQNTEFLRELFNIFEPEETDQQRKKDAVLFIQQCCSVAKTLQTPGRAQLYQSFISHGLFAVITFALKHHDPAVRVAGTDVLVAVIDHDPSMMRSCSYKTLNEKSQPLTDTLIELLLVEGDLGVKAQVADAIKVLLDPNASTQTAETLGRTNSDFLAKIRANTPTNTQTQSFIQSFYDEPAKKLFQPLKDLEGRESMDNLTMKESTLYVHLIELLCFLIRQHAYQSKFFILSEGLAARVAQLMSSPEKHLKLMALKYFRTCIGLQDEFHTRHIIQNNLFEPILNIVYETMPRDNLLNSACLELFEYIKRENIKPVINHVVERYREKLNDITYVDTFQNLILRYEQMQGHQPGHDNSFVCDNDDTPSRGLINGGQRYIGLKDADAEEEAYFNTSDNEDEEESTTPETPKAVVNGASPLVKPLVDYPDDEDELMETIPEEKEPDPIDNTQSTPPKDPNTAHPPPPLPRTPPERLSEKRRREEDDDEDELGKLTLQHTKRRGSSVSSNGSHASSGSQSSSLSISGNSSLRRRKSGNMGKDGPPKRIAISLAVKRAGDEGMSHDRDGGA